MKNKNNLNLNAKHPKRSVLEEIGNSITHGVGSVFAIHDLGICFYVF